jgi:putative oxidoreductase
MFGQASSKYAPTLQGILRIVAGFLFFPHGGQKLLGWFGGMGGNGATAAFPSLIWFAGALELVGVLLILFGLFTRPVAFILSGEMAFAYFMGHAKNGFWPLVNHGELAFLYCFLFLFYAAAGPGRFAIDNVIRKKNI